MTDISQEEQHISSFQGVCACYPNLLIAKDLPHMDFFPIVETEYFSQQLYPSRNPCRKVSKPVALRILEEITA